MKHCWSLLLCLSMSACGYQSRGNELTGQVKKVAHQTPLFCPARVDADVSLGVIRNGVGSMSSQDVWLTVPNHEDARLLEEAARTGVVVNVSYDVARVVFCVEDHIVSKVEVAK